jgi:hypothetical protein
MIPVLESMPRLFPQPPRSIRCLKMSLKLLIYQRVKSSGRDIRGVLIKSKNWFTRIALKISVKYCPRLYQHLILSNDVWSQKDGTGAQIQRMLAVAALSKALHIPFAQNEIIDIAVHPLDPFQDSDSYRAFLQKLNEQFKVQDAVKVGPNTRIVRIRELRFVALVKIAIRSSFYREKTLLVIESPYPVSDLNVEFYSQVVCNLKLPTKKKINPNSKRFIAIHYRQGVGNHAIYPGQSISREIGMEYFRKQIEIHYSDGESNNLEVHVFTDAPAEKMYYIPPENQRYLWEGTPGFVEGVMEIQPLLFTPTGLGVKNVIIHSGGDPVDAIMLMSQAELLIIGRSSLSYTAGILNQDGVVVAPPGFWHPPLKKWQKGTSTSVNSPYKP